MSGVGYQHNKFDTCMDCPDRSADPDCHSTCRGYLYRQAENERQKELKRREYDYKDYAIGRALDERNKHKR